MMRELFSDPPPRVALVGNYATRMVHLWIVGDPVLDEQCRECAREWHESGDSRAWLDGRVGTAGGELSWVLATELRILVTASALAVETEGLFLDLFTVDAREVDWTAIAAFYLDGEWSGLRPRQ